jgi:hypothetical protein
MAYHEKFVRNPSYLVSGKLSDLTLNFGSKTWQIHKALIGATCQPELTLLFVLTDIFCWYTLIVRASLL